MATTKNLGFGENIRSSSDPNRIRFDPNNTDGHPYRDLNGHTNLYADHHPHR